ncbi:MAG: transposase, partial [Bacteroidota bacterium]|nr:transposase [Bacteroidota bacterium]
EWECPGCGEKVWRDLNAAMNIKEFGLKKKTGVGRTEKPAELPAMVGAEKQERIVRAGYA